MNYVKLIVVGIVLLIGGVIFASLGLQSDNKPPVIVVTTVTNSSGQSGQTVVTETSERAEPSLDELKKSIDTEKVKPNELGEIMVLMYHRIGDEDLEYDRSVASFKKDLETLYEKGFRSISMKDYLDSNFDLPAGMTPVVFTFDDGDGSHFKVSRDAKGNLIPDPNCAVGILDEFSRRHPDFGRHAIFYLNAGAFEEPEHLEWKLSYLSEHGYEVGNHTYGHDFLDNLNAAEIQESIGGNVAYYKRIYDAVEMDSLALPYGIAPSHDLENYAVEGEFEGLKYYNRALFLVGWRPTWPLYTAGMNPRGINRVQSGEMQHQMWWWLDVYEENPGNRFISDGVREIISIPETWAGDLNRQAVEMDRVLIYPVP